ncbi:hypothetical protein Chor_006564 [Crotalus horridus]
MSQEFNLNLLKELEQEIVLNVLCRDEMLRKLEEERVRAIKVKTGEWFFEERAKKFPTEGRYETAGAKLLKSYQKLRWEGKHLHGTPRSTLSPLTSLAIHCQKCSSISGEQDDSRVACIKASSEEGIPSVITNNTLICGDKKRDSLYSITSVCSGAVDFEKTDVCGEIEFAIRYNFKFGFLEVFISACRNLAYGKEEKKKCNPYVKTYLLPDKSPQSKRKTSAKKNTLNPTFQEILKVFEAILGHIVKSQGRA